MLVGVTAPLPRSTMKAERSHQLFPQHRLVLPHLFASQARVRRRDYLQPGLGNVLSALLTPPVLRSLQLDECPVDRLDLGLYAFIQAIEQLNQTLPLPLRLYPAFDVGFKPEQLRFYLGHLTNQVTPLREQLLPNIVTSSMAITLPDNRNFSYNMSPFSL
ncbi:MAG: hypothetical protein ABI955_05340 [Nitrospirota bacterium]